MIYETPAFRPGGDRYMLIEFGNEMNLELNFMAQGLATAIAEQKTRGVIETAPCFASMLIHYEPDEISYADLSRELERLIAALGPSDDIELESRIFYFPTVYLDPWTRECVQDYIAKIAPKQTDPEFVAELNGLTDVQQFVRVHSGTEYWVASLGFWPGLPFMMALDPRCKLTAPKYNPPRTWTPKGTVGMGGASTAIYPEHLPGGYQIFGRIPVPIWDPEKRFDVFSDSICLFRPGDRVKFVPCTVEEFEEAERRVADGSYVYNLVEYQKFSVRQYKRWVGSLDLARRF
ncbi:carboxyltransferase domain-containing protein [Mycobacterium sp. KBS0706]|uniref:5-oxoprolinase subunit B family protein n=1 Tax=Mycobacterium sp. KBS0706 TaxID=2578109 RepID=UPI00110FCB90|nr:carboxyltransferase domain-containing protein [Mycobacterium sp. KBS0706]TSD90047.1 carboxyltransferase domain-containing protein [Mycobacterium sp. KBS0706]